MSSFSGIFLSWQGLFFWAYLFLCIDSSFAYLFLCASAVSCAYFSLCVVHFLGFFSLCVGRFWCIFVSVTVPFLGHLFAGTSAISLAYFPLFVIFNFLTTVSRASYFLRQCCFLGIFFTVFEHTFSLYQWCFLGLCLWIFSYISLSLYHCHFLCTYLFSMVAVPFHEHLLCVGVFLGIFISSPVPNSEHRFLNSTILCTILSVWVVSWAYFSLHKCRFLEIYFDVCGSFLGHHFLCVTDVSRCFLVIWFNGKWSPH